MQAQIIHSYKEPKQMKSDHQHFTYRHLLPQFKKSVCVKRAIRKGVAGDQRKMSKIEIQRKQEQEKKRKISRLINEKKRPFHFKF